MTYELISRNVFYDGSYQANVVRACDYYMGQEETGVLWDVGANIGAVSLPLLRRHRGWTSVCFQPSPAVAASLCRNRALNPEFGDRLQVVCGALTCREGLEEFYVSSESHNSGVGSLQASHNTSSRPILIGGYEGDGLVEQEAIPRPDVVKIDVEGFEFEVLRGIEGLLRESASLSIIFELSKYRYNARSDIAALEVVEYVESFGFRVSHLGDPMRGIETLNREDPYGDVVAVKQ